MVSCVVRGLSRSIVGGASLSYRHMIKTTGSLFTPNCSRVVLWGRLGSRVTSVDVEVEALAPLVHLKFSS